MDDIIAQTNYLQQNVKECVDKIGELIALTEELTEKSRDPFSEYIFKETWYNLISTLMDLHTIMDDLSRLAETLERGSSV